MGRLVTAIGVILLIFGLLKLLGVIALAAAAATTLIVVGVILIVVGEYVLGGGWFGYNRTRL